jgi:hypothetical protein
MITLAMKIEMKAFASLLLIIILIAETMMISFPASLDGIEVNHNAYAAAST